jgi:hypothetical protein
LEAASEIITQASRKDELMCTAVTQTSGPGKVVSVGLMVSRSKRSDGFHSVQRALKVQRKRKYKTMIAF